MYKIAIFSLSLFLLFSCKVEEKEAFPGHMQSQLNKLPVKAGFVAYINIAKIKKSPLYDLFHENAEDNFLQHKEYRRFSEQTGFDVNKDIDEIYLATMPVADHSALSGVFLALGTFQPDKIIAFLAEENEVNDLKSEQIDTFTIYHLSDDDDVYFCFKDNQTLIAGKKDLVREALETPADKKNLELLPQIKALKYKNWAWMVMQTGPFLEKLDYYDFSERFQGAFSVVKADLTMKFGDEFYFQGKFNCVDNDKAEILRDAVKGGIAAAKLSMSDDREAINTLNKIEVNVEDKNVITSGEMTRSDLEKLISKKLAL